jgi:mannose-6-phosphate isomerase-like protein (cupin superfamily)
MAYLLAMILLLAGSSAAPGGQAAKAAEKKAEKPAAVVYIPAKEVEAATKKPGTKIFDAPKYSIMFFRRTAAGEAELHEADSDVFYIVDGSATFVTGGTIVGGKTTAPGEIRGASISGGQTHHLSKGDVITIPKGVPHWYSGVSGTLTYFIVKIR